MKDDKLKVLIVSQYFWPENMRINDLVSTLSARGNEVTVLTGIPNYPDGKVYSDFLDSPGSFSEYSNSRIVRVPMLPRGKSTIKLVLNYLSFLISASIFGPFKLRGKDFDAIFFYGVSPITSAFPAIILGKLKKAPIYLWVLDLWPESLSAVGIINNSLILKFVGLFVSIIYYLSDYILIQSKGFFESVQRHCPRKRKENIIYFPSWAEDIFTKKSSKNSQIIDYNPDQFTILFAGNIGEAQDFPSILNSMERIVTKKYIRLLVVGDGRMKLWLENEIRKRKIQNITLLGKFPLEDMPALYSNVDALLVTLKKHEIFAKTIPAKVQSYLASEKPILGMLDGEGAKVILESGAGLCGGSGEDLELTKNIIELSEMAKPKLKELGENAKKYYLQEFSKDYLFNKLESLFRQNLLNKESKC